MDIQECGFAYAQFLWSLNFGIFIIFHHYFGVFLCSNLRTVTIFAVTAASRFMLDALSFNSETKDSRNFVERQSSLCLLVVSLAKRFN
jgi:hypothetical protein